MAQHTWRARRHSRPCALVCPRCEGLNFVIETIGRNDFGGFQPRAFQEMVWRQYEIENYLIHPAAILRWLASWGMKPR